MPLAGGQEFGSSVNPIPTRGADYAHHITGCPSGFKNLTASLLILEPVFSSWLLILSLHRKFSWTNYASYLIRISSRLNSHSLNNSGRYNSRFFVRDGHKATYSDLHHAANHWFLVNFLYRTFWRNFLMEFFDGIFWLNFLMKFFDVILWRNSSMEFFDDLFLSFNHCELYQWSCFILNIILPTLTSLIKG